VCGLTDLLVCFGLCFHVAACFECGIPFCLVSLILESRSVPDSIAGLAPDNHLCDGSLQLVHVKPVSRLQFLRFLIHVAIPV
jgi:hypothetical protein